MFRRFEQSVHEPILRMVPLSAAVGHPQCSCQAEHRKGALHGDDLVRSPGIMATGGLSARIPRLRHFRVHLGVQSHFIDRQFLAGRCIRPVLHLSTVSTNGEETAMIHDAINFHAVSRI